MIVLASTAVILPSRVMPKPMLHAHGVTPAVGVEHLFARVEDLHRATGLHGQLGHAELEVERLALAPERPAERRLDHADAMRGELEHLGELAVEVVRDLRGRPHGEQARLAGPAAALHVGHRAVRLDRGVGGAFEEVLALDHHVGGGEPGIHVAELEQDLLAEVAGLAVGVDLHRARVERLLRVEVGGQELVHHLDGIERLDGGVLVDRRHRGHAVAHVEHLVQGQRILVGRPRDDAVGDGKVAAGDHRVHARHGQRPARIDGDDARVRVGAALDLAVEQPRELEVVGVAGDAPHALHRVDLAMGAAELPARPLGGLGGIVVGVVGHGGLPLLPWCHCAAARGCDGGSSAQAPSG
jgi:hypothetical protein